ncbi:MarR family winged helix-turn-helix transcriptional regulator [Granulicoccus phenolivorans]|uniref:MarR family winged helix-turn-helix transcriptional regulator n=1 Tax=Granulicoccus phenolivorans TaxID=266854 RepID=UPI000418E8C4|nr:MarR family transcriptional regulator [Granulicoccus phenolivorans]
MSEPSILVLMYIAQRSAENRIVTAIQDAGYDITLAQARVMARINPEGTRLSELAEAAQITKQTATALIDRLETAGWVERVPDPTDGRARLVRLTAQAWLGPGPLARATERAIEAEWTEQLGEPLMAELRRAMLSLREITDPYR